MFFDIKINIILQSNLGVFRIRRCVVIYDCMPETMVGSVKIHQKDNCKKQHYRICSTRANATCSLIKLHVLTLMSARG